MGKVKSSSVVPRHSDAIQRLYDAETAGEGIQCLLSFFPRWVPPFALLSLVGVYGVTMFARLKFTRWRIAERHRAQATYELLANLRGFHTVGGGRAGSRGHALSEDDVDDDEEDEEDETAVTMRDVDEFRSSLGVLLPRDEDLLGIIERMLVVDPIPEGWVLYRTTAGIIRFMNNNTQELSFFPPNKRKEQEHIEAELRRRNREAMQSKYATQASSMLLEEEGSFRTIPHGNTPRRREEEEIAMRSGFDSTHAGESESDRLKAGGSSPYPVGNDTSGGRDRFPHSPHDLFDPANSKSVVKRMLNYFLEREQKKIEKDVFRSHRRAESRDYSSSDSDFSNNDEDDDETESADRQGSSSRMFGVGSRESEGAGRSKPGSPGSNRHNHRHRASASCRVVSSVNPARLLPNTTRNPMNSNVTTTRQTTSDLFVMEEDSGIHSMAGPVDVRGDPTLIMPALRVSPASFE